MEERLALTKAWREACGCRTGLQSRLGSVGGETGKEGSGQITKPFKCLGKKFRFYPVSDGKHGRFLMESDKTKFVF